MMYRPEGIVNPYVECKECKYEPDSCNMEHCEGDKEEFRAFEAGADAMYEALEKEGLLVPAYSVTPWLDIFVEDWKLIEGV